MDFSAPGATAFYGGLLGEAVDDGYDGWMEDFGEYTPPDSRSANGMGGESMHNLYPTLYHRASGDFQRRRGGVAAFGRSGWTGAAAGMQMVWGGDPTVDWGFDGLSSAVTQALTMGTSGVSRWGSDIGGFFALGIAPADARAADPLDPVRRRVRRHAHAGRGRGACPTSPGRRSPTRRSCPSGAATRSCARSSIPTWRRPTAPTGAPGCR